MQIDSVKLIERLKECLEAQSDDDNIAFFAGVSPKSAHACGIRQSIAAVKEAEANGAD